MADEDFGEVSRVVDARALDDPDDLPPELARSILEKAFADDGAEEAPDQHHPYDDTSRQEPFPRDQYGFHHGGSAF
jgi:hypothetical protein